MVVAAWANRSWRIMVSMGISVVAVMLYEYRGHMAHHRSIAARARAAAREHQR